MLTFCKFRGVETASRGGLSGIFLSGNRNKRMPCGTKVEINKCMGCVLCGVCTVWGMYSVRCVQCGVCTEWGVYSVGCVQCGVCAVWGVYSVGCVQCGVCTV